MTPNPDESFESWAERARMYEQGFAMQRIAKGEDVETVMQDMTRRLTDKLMHPIYRAIKDSVITEFDAEKSRREYEEKYLKFRKPIADHVDGVLFDNSSEK